MKCPFCGYNDSKVVDSRHADEGDSIRRRRVCLSCGKRFTTYETVEQVPLMVIKRDGSRQAFDRQKMLRGMIRACYKRPVSTETLEQLSIEIEQELRNSLTLEVSAEQVGELVMAKLKEVDDVSYVRFASVYRQFRDITTFRDELDKLLSQK
ncbi:MAG: transcriptional regulator NrdR [Clostridiales bacterium]|nr:transcriptional regulator NrdR [Clostridiales bacterium]